MSDDLQKYCISATKEDSSIMLILPLTEEQFGFFCNSPQIEFNIGNGIMLMLNRPELDSFSIQLVQ